MPNPPLVSLGNGVDRVESRCRLGCVGWTGRGEASCEFYFGERPSCCASLCSLRGAWQVLAQGLSDQGRTAKEIVSELTDFYGQLEDIQRELQDLHHPGLEADRLQALQRGIQRFAALARFG